MRLEASKANSLRILSAILRPLILTSLAMAIAMCAGGGTSGTGTLRVSGLVVNPSGDPLAGVQVLALATGEGTVTDSLGIFLIETEPESSLEFTLGTLRTAVSLDSIPPEAAAVRAIFELKEEPQGLSGKVIDVVVTEEKTPPTPTASSQGPSPSSEPTQPPGTVEATATPEQAPGNPTEKPTGKPTKEPNQPIPTATNTPEATPTETPSVPPPSPTPTATSSLPYPRGDINCDGYIDFGDLACMQAILIGRGDQEPSCYPASGCPFNILADLNQDGRIDEKDANILVDLL